VSPITPLLTVLKDIQAISQSLSEIWLTYRKAKANTVASLDEFKLVSTEGMAN
jgi:hypothetical protein